MTEYSVHSGLSSIWFYPVLYWNLTNNASGESFIMKRLVYLTLLGASVVLGCTIAGSTSAQAKAGIIADTNNSATNPSMH